MKQIEINPSNELHILRHFEYVSEEYKATLLGKEYYYHNLNLDKFEKGIIDGSTVEMALNTKGSKFFKEINRIKNPNDILKIIKSEFEKIPLKKQNWSGTKDKKLFPFLINYDYPVGFKNLVHINDLTKEEQLKIKKVPRGAHQGENTVMVKVIENIPMKSLNTIEVGLVDVKELPFYFVTAYPGDLEVTADFPNNKQSKEEYEFNYNYWDNHVFINS